MQAHAIATLALAALICGPSVARAQDEWSRFRGPNGGGVAADDGRPLPTTLVPDAALWKCPVGAGHSSPCVQGGRVFLTEASGEELATLCIDRASGELLWRRAVAPRLEERLHSINSAASPTPTADGDRVYAYFGSFGLVAYDHAGEEAWRRELDDPDSTFGTAASPVVAGGKLVLNRDTNADSYLEVIDGATGETVWRKDRSGFRSGWSTPVVRRHAGGSELLVYGIWWLTAYDLADGSERWSVPGLSDEPCVTPVQGEGLVYLSSYNMRTSPEVIGLPTFAALLEQYDGDGDGQLSRAEVEPNQSVLSRADADGEGDHPLRIFFRFLDEDTSGRIDAEEWRKLPGWLDTFQHANAIVAVRPPEGEGGKAEIAWQHPRGVPEIPSPLYYRGRVYAVKNGGIATCLDARTGELKWEGRIDSRGPCYASPVAGDGKLYTASARGVVTVFAAGDELEVLAQSDLGERIMATPALVEGRVYLRTEGHLYAFGARE